MTERNDLERRAAAHAALADPVRLRIVDLLTLGDLAPSELQDQLGISSSLLAHHLNVLAHEGMIVRSRSEADRRRSYIRLIPGAFRELGPSAAAGAKRVLFVCTANSARSQLAAAIWNRTSAVAAASAGTHPADRVDPGTIATAERHHLPLPSAVPRRLADVLEDGDFVITVCDTAHEELGTADALHWSIPDPVRVGTQEAFDAAFEELVRRVEDLAPRLNPHGDAT